jgi:hypothetical protein
MMAFDGKCINELVAELVEELGLNDQRMRPMLLTWIYEAVLEIGVSQLQEQETQWLPIQDFKMKKPKGFMWLRQLVIQGDNNRCITPRLQARYRCSCPCENIDIACDITMVEYGTYYGLSTDAKEFTKYKMLYVSTPVSEDGLPMLETSSVKAVKQYVLYKFLQKQRRSFPEKVPMSEIDYNLRLWQKYKDQAWARLMTPDDAALKTIAIATWRSGITPQDMQYGYGMYYDRFGYLVE